MSHLTIHVQVDNKVALAYLLKMGSTRSPQLLKFSKSILNYLLFHQITSTAEYLPSRLNVKADWESRNATDTSDWRFHQKVYLKITKLLEIPTLDLFCLQAVTNFPNTWHKGRSKQFCNRCNSTGLEQIVWFSSVPFSLIGRVINKVFRKM